ncbi:MAG: CBS domain-containing protein [Magnetospirillum sp.]|nr:MAG: CBS domain-containing protein [Magnetospirillum sp.]
MRVEEVIAIKGDLVHTIGPGASVHEAATLLQDMNIGALVCTDPTGGVIGILSERDISRAVARFGWDSIDMSVSETMTRDVISCRMEDEVDYLLAVMTETRCRHIPVVRDGRVIGMISMGDLVKIRLE